MEKKTSRVCEFCGETFYVIPSRMKHGRGKHCSPKCQYANMRNKPRRAEILWFFCRNCGDNFWLYKSYVKGHKGAGKYCCRKCRDIHRKGKYSPNFIHGNGTNWHGINWYSQRRKAKKRDKHICQHCSLEEKDCIKKYGQPLHVHHIIPSRLFGENYEVANNLSNLVTLCPRCHRIAEAKIQKNEQKL